MSPEQQDILSRPQKTNSSPFETKPDSHRIRRAFTKACVVATSLVLASNLAPGSEGESLLKPAIAEAQENTETQGMNNFDNSKIVDAGVAENGMSFATGWAQPGECMVAAQRWATTANGGKNIWKYKGVISTYTSSGGVEVGLDKLRPGDILQRASSGTDADTNFHQVHTVVFRGYGKNGTYNIVDSNRGFDGKVRVTDAYSLYAPAGWQWRAFRMGKVSGDQPAPTAKADLPTFVPDIVQRPDGETNIAAVGPGNSLDFYYNRAGSPHWGKVPVAIGGYALSSPDMIQRPSGETNIAVVGKDNSLDFYINSPGSPAWGKLTVAGPGSAYSKPAILQRPSGETNIAVRGPNNTLDFYYNFPGSPHWGKVPVATPNQAYSAPAMVQRANGETDIAVLGPDNSLNFYFNQQGSPYWGLSRVAINGWAHSAPAMIQRPNTGETNIAVQGPNNTLDFYINQAGSPAWGRIRAAGDGSTHTAPNAPALTQRSNGETNIAVRGPNNSADFYFNALGSPIWSKLPVAINGYSQRTPAMIQRQINGETDLAIVGPSNRLDFYINSQGSPAWGNLPIAPNHSAS